MYDEEESMDETEFSNLPFSEITFEAGECKPWESKLSGTPYMHAPEEYPIGKNGKPMLFMAQINLKDIHHIPELPEKGLLQFFLEQDDCYGLFSHSPAVVRWIENIVETEEGLLPANPFATEEYLETIPLDRPGKMHFTERLLTSGDEPEENHQVGGYPTFIQDGEMDPEEEFLLLQLTCDYECGIGWGDGGVCNFFINREDLAARDFSNVWFDWQCC